MKAAVFHEYGPPEVLRYEDVPDPVAGPGEVIVRIHASAIGHVDLDSRDGTSRHPLKLPHILGREMAGEVCGVGPGVESTLLGMRVLVRSVLPCGTCAECRAGFDNMCSKGEVLGIHRPGGYAELVAAPATSLVPIPQSLDYFQAAAVPSAFGTAWHMAVGLAGAREGDWVLIPSASGGVATACVQVAKHLGCHVIATASTPVKAERVRALGADHLILYPDVDVAKEVLRITGGRGVDIVLELVGGPNIASGLACLAARGRFIMGGSHAGEVVPVDFIHLLRKEVQILGARRSTRTEFETVVRLAGEGSFKPIIDIILPLADAAEAHRRMAARANFGKILLAP